MIFAAKLIQKKKTLTALGKNRFRDRAKVQEGIKEPLHFCKSITTCFLFSLQTYCYCINVSTMQRLDVNFVVSKHFCKLHVSTLKDLLPLVSPSQITPSPHTAPSFVPCSWLGSQVNTHVRAQEKL